MAGFYNTNASVGAVISKSEYLDRKLNAKLGKPSPEINLKCSDGTHCIVKDGTQAEIKYKTVKRDFTDNVDGVELFTVKSNGMESADQKALVQGIQNIINGKKNNSPAVAAMIIS